MVDDVQAFVDAWLVEFRGDHFFDGQNDAVLANHADRSASITNFVKHFKEFTRKKGKQLPARFHSFVGVLDLKNSAVWRELSS